MASQDAPSLLAQCVDMVHALSMLVWVGGLPLFVWRGAPTLSRIYVWFALIFVVATVTSHAMLGECFLTALSRRLWAAADDNRENVPFTITLTNAIAGIRPSERSAVLAWELLVLVTCVGTLWNWHRSRLSTGPSKRSTPRR